MAIYFVVRQFRIIRQYILCDAAGALHGAHNSVPVPDKVQSLFLKHLLEEASSILFKVFNEGVDVWLIPTKLVGS